HEARQVARGIKARERVDGGVEAVSGLDGRQGGVEATVGVRVPCQGGLDFGVQLWLNKERTRARNVEQHGPQRLAEIPVLGAILEETAEEDANGGQQQEAGA